MDLKDLKPGDLVTFRKLDGTLSRGTILHRANGKECAGWIADMSPEFSAASLLPMDGYGDRVQLLYGTPNPFDLEDI